MADDAWNDTQERYTIGFTENQYSHYNDKSPSPTDHLLGYNSPSLDYAERFNKGTANICLDRTVLLDKQKSRSVGKINTNILDLVFELTERRKATPTPLNRSYRSDYRPDSRLSDTSGESIKTSSSLPLIQVQQLPPVSKCFSPPISDRSFIKIPDINLSFTEDIRSPTKTKKMKRKKQKTKGTISEDKKEDMKEPKLTSIVQQMILFHKTNNDKGTISLEGNDMKSFGNQNKEYEKPSTRLSHNETDDMSKYPAIPPPPTKPKIENKWTLLTQRIVDVQKRVREDPEKFNEYKGRYHTPKSSSKAPNMTMSFCQSSKGERSEKERIYNIRRRHSSQVNTGPLDFNKLRRQITSGRSNTMCR